MQFSTDAADESKYCKEFVNGNWKNFDYFSQDEK